MKDEQTQPHERGVLATAYWSLLEKRLADPKFAELADKPGFGAKLGEETGKLLEEVSVSVFDSIMAAHSDTVAENHELRRDFEATVERVWGKPLDLLYAFHGICMEVGDSCNRRYRDRACDEDDFSWQAIVRLHARSCLVMGEVLALMRSGYASGAHARCARCTSSRWLRSFYVSTTTRSHFATCNMTRFRRTSPRLPIGATASVSAKRH